VTLHLLTHAWVARAIRLPAVLVVQRARLRDVLARVHLPAAPAPPPAPCAAAAARACGLLVESWYNSLAPESVFTSITVYRGGWGTAGVARPPPALACVIANARGGGDVWGNGRTRPGEHGLG